MKNFFRRLFRTGRKTGNGAETRKASGSLMVSDVPAVAQVEVTTRCNLACTMCPRTHVPAERDIDFSWDVFQKFAGGIPKLNLVYLQGWGEPLLHPRIFDMAALVKENNARVGFTTNGTLLGEAAIAEILGIGVDYVTVSLSGPDADVHNAIRIGSDFDSLLGNVSNLVDAKKRKGVEKPAVHLSYMVTRQSIAGLPEMVKKAHEIGVNRLVAPNLDCPITRENEETRVFGFQEPDKALQEALDNAQILANRLKVKLGVYPLKLSDEILECELKPTSQFFVTVHGDVAPCAYAGILGRQPFTRYFQSEPVLTEPLLFGSLAEQEMDAIWNSPDYRQFRIRYHNRLKGYNDVSINRSSIHSMFGLKEYLRELDEMMVANPIPPFCRKCYKACGA